MAKENLDAPAGAAGALGRVHSGAEPEREQVAAANGVPVVWYMNNERTATALRLWAIDNDVKGIEFVFRPVPVTG